MKARINEKGILEIIRENKSIQQRCKYDTSIPTLTHCDIHCPFLIKEKDKISVCCSHEIITYFE